MSMFRLARRRPSPALIVACCSLFVALGGTSYAVAVGSVGSPQIRDDSIRGIDVRHRALSGNDLRADSIGGAAIKEEALDVTKLDLPVTNGAVLQVRVELTGRHSLGRGVVDVEHLRAGTYHVVFERDVSRCVPATTVYPEMPGSAIVMVSPSTTDTRAFQVITSGSTGIPHDQGFYLLVSC